MDVSQILIQEGFVKEVILVHLALITLSLVDHLLNLRLFLKGQYRRDHGFGVATAPPWRDPFQGQILSQLLRELPSNPQDEKDEQLALACLGALAWVSMNFTRLPCIAHDSPNLTRQYKCRNSLDVRWLPRPKTVGHNT